MRYLPRWGSLQRSPDPLAGNGGGPPGEGEGKGKDETGGEGRCGEGRGGKGRGRAIPPNENPGYGFVGSLWPSYIMTDLKIRQKSSQQMPGRLFEDLRYVYY